MEEKSNFLRLWFQLWTKCRTRKSKTEDIYGKCSILFRTDFLPQRGESIVSEIHTSVENMPELFPVITLQIVFVTNAQHINIRCGSVACVLWRTSKSIYGIFHSTAIPSTHPMSHFGFGKQCNRCALWTCAYRFLSLFASVIVRVCVRIDDWDAMSNVRRNDWANTCYLSTWNSIEINEPNAAHCDARASRRDSNGAMSPEQFSFALIFVVKVCSFGEPALDTGQNHRVQCPIGPSADVRWTLCVCSCTYTIGKKFTFWGAFVRGWCRSLQKRNDRLASVSPIVRTNDEIMWKLSIFNENCTCDTAGASTIRHFPAQSLSHTYTRSWRNVR